MQTATPENVKGRRPGQTPTHMQTAGDATAHARHQQAPSLTPRYRRILLALLVGQRTREDIDRIAGASNGPDEVLRIRRRFGLVIPRTRKGSTDVDGHPVEFGIYRLTEADRRIARSLLAGAS